VVKKKPEEDGKAVLMPGGLICAGKPIRSIIQHIFLWLRGLSLICRDIISRRGCYAAPSFLCPYNKLEIEPLYTYKKNSEAREPRFFVKRKPCL
jgi:hypothetical protein